MIGSVSFYPVSSVAPAHEAPAASTQPSALPLAPSYATISRAGALLSKLQALGESDPGKLQDALSHVSHDLHASAQNASGAKADALVDLSIRFAQAGASGNISAVGGSTSQALLGNVLAQMDEAMGMNPPPFGPWFTQ